MKINDFAYYNAAIKSSANAIDDGMNALDDQDAIFDMDFQVSHIEQETPGNELITSKVACTPGCGNTGTGNSFCCTCR